MRYLSLLEELADDSIEWLDPTFDPETGGVEYPRIEQPGETADEHLSATLEALAERGVLEQEFVDQVIACPSCNSTDFRFRLSCSECGSANTEEVAIIEHTDCDCVRPREQFGEGEPYICPKCDTAIESLDEECERTGTVYHCQECGGRMDALDHHLDCVECGSYVPEETDKVQLHRYRFDDARQELLDDLLTVRTGITAALEARGYDVHRDSGPTSESGEKHRVDLYATDATFGVELVIAIRNSVDVSSISDLQTVADATGTHPTLATTATTQNETAVKFAEQEGITVVRVDQESNAEIIGQ